MNLYLDTLVSFMPDSVLDAEGKLIPNASLAAGRNAMIDLVRYNRTYEIKSLYSAIDNACKYANANMIDVVLATTNCHDIDLGSIAPSYYFISQAATLLFKSIKPSEEFNVVLFVSYLLTAIHKELDAQYESQQNVIPESK